MKLAIMQPYAFPYLGYFQLMSAVDRFVLYDDVAFTKRSWINRNFLGAPKGPSRFTIPVVTPRQGQAIETIRLHAGETYQGRLLKTIEHLYHRAPHYEQARPVLERAIQCSDDNLAKYLSHSLEVLKEYLGIATPLIRSSQRHRRSEQKGQNRLIEICQAEGADVYVNAEGGMQLYQGAAFQQQGIDLWFLIHQPRPYRQNAKEFLPRLSIIDVIMFNGQEDIRRLLHDHLLLRADCKN